MCPVSRFSHSRSQRSETKSFSLAGTFGSRLHAKPLLGVAANMAPKPASASKPSLGKKLTSAKKGESGTTSIVAATTEPTDEVQTFAPAKTKEEVLQQVSFDGLPVADPAQIIEILSGKYKQLIEVFAHCCKFSDCKTMEMATRCRLGALSHLAQRGSAP